MTGFGRTSRTVGEKTITVEIRAVNSKGSDFRVKLPSGYRDREIQVRKWLQDDADRGKIDVSIEIRTPYGDDALQLNKPLFRQYYAQLRELAEELGAHQGDMIQAILRIPNVVHTGEAIENEEEWAEIESIFQEAFSAFIKFRQDEGAILRRDFEHRIGQILQYLQEVAPFEGARILRVRERLGQLVNSQLTRDQVDANRFEQELIFYLEKMDITEEKVRLEQHCRYFLEVLQGNELSKGRKLNFISQEIGREINTLGAKASDADIQRIVVAMKDELEKVKEQLANIV